MANSVLPFPRGRTASDFGLAGLTLTSTSFAELEGMVYEVPDTVHGTGGKVKIRAVRNTSGSAITTARNLFKFDATAELAVGRKVSGLTSVVGQLCKPLDDAYVVDKSIPANDIFYVVEEGPCSLVLEASAVSLSTNDPVTCDASGFLDGARTAASKYVVGSADTSYSSGGVTAVVWVRAGLPPSDL